MIQRPLSLLCVSLCLAAALLYAPPAAGADSAQDPPEPELLGFTIELGLATAYLDRGLNIFGQTQRDANWILSPSLSYAILDSGLSLAYWGAYQLNGANRQKNIRAGTGHEQDFILAYETAWLADTLQFAASLNAILYPFALKREAGARCPVYLEPSLKLGYSTALDLSLQLLYSAGLQKAIKDWRYLYVRPYVSKSFALGEKVGLLLGLGYGYKLFNERRKMTENVHDVSLDLETKLQFSEHAYLTPTFRIGWTDLKNRSFAGELVLLSSLSAGFDF